MTPRPVPAAPSEPGDSVSLSAQPFDLQAIIEATASEAASLESKLPEHLPREVLVKMPTGTTPEQMRKLASDYEAQVVYEFRVPESIKEEFGGEMVWLKMDNLRTSQAIAALEKDQRVLYAASNDVRDFHQPVDTDGEAPQTQDPPNEPPRKLPNDLHSRQYAFRNGRGAISAPEAWQVTTGTRQGPIIALLDTGVDYTHPDLAANIWTNPNEVANGVDDDGNGIVDDIHGYDSVGHTGDPMDRNSHGTHCAGIIGAVGNNGQGVVGTNWEAQILPIRALGRSSTGARVRALFYATEQGASITSNSWGYTKTNPAEADAFRASPQLHICASGNAGANNDKTGDFPSGLPDASIVSVASSDSSNKMSSFSNYGAHSVDLAAPGSDIYSTVPRGGYRSMSGTSMSTPMVAGVAGLIAAAHPEASIEQIKTRLLNSVDRSSAFEGKMTSGGRLNAARAVEFDNVAPAQPGLVAQVKSPDRVRLVWNATADDGAEGVAASRTRIAISENGRSTNLATDFPAAPGTTESLNVAVFPSGQERVVQFGLAIEDNVGNRSPESSLSVTVPAANTAFEDNGLTTETWEADGFTRVSENGISSWTDSPDGNYENRTKASLTSRPIDLSSLKDSKVALEVRYDLERGHDKVYLEAAEMGAERPNWRKLETFHGRSERTTHTADLSRFDGSTIKLRLRMETDESVVADGFTLDRVVVYGQS